MTKELDERQRRWIRSQEEENREIKVGDRVEEIVTVTYRTYKARAVLNNSPRECIPNQEDSGEHTALVLCLDISCRRGSMWTS